MKRDDRLKNILSWKISTGPEEIRVWTYISPVANIKVVWVWGGWGNAINRMIETNLEWVEFLAINTDAQALYNSLSESKINIWRATTWGLWAWANPDMWKKAAEESSEEIKAALEWADMVFITCWLGGGTGSGAAPVVAEIAKSLGALTVGVVTKPFSFEGQSRSSKALEAYDSLKDKVDTLITIPNDRILTIIDKKTPLLDAFSIVDEVLREWVQWVSDLITQPGLINVDFADVKSVMKNAGSALMWIWYGSWENRAVEAARSAIDSPLLELSIAWAKWVLFNITWWTDLSMFEVDEAAKIITESVDSDANIIFGATINDDYTGELKITVVATWFDEESNKTFTSQWSSISKMSAFGRKPVNETVRQVQQTPVREQAQPQDDLDVPAFLRKKI